MESETEIDGPSLPQVSERRLEIFERTRAKYASAGIKLDDPQYLALIDKWIDGEITMPKAAEKWDEARKGRKRNKARPPANFDHPDLESLSKITQEQILAEIAKLTEEPPTRDRRKSVICGQSAIRTGLTSSSEL